MWNLLYFPCTNMYNRGVQNCCRQSVYTNFIFENIPTYLFMRSFSLFSNIMIFVDIFIHIRYVYIMLEKYILLFIGLKYNHSDNIIVLHGNTPPESNVCKIYISSKKIPFHNWTVFGTCIRLFICDVLMYNDWNSTRRFSVSPCVYII